MAFVFTAETGSGVAGANAYVAVAAADDYHSGRGNTTWAALSSGAKQAAIVKATDHIELLFSERFIGTRKTLDQGLSWPRDDAYDVRDPDGEAISGVPVQVQNACAEYALRASTAALLVDGPAVTSESKSAGDLSRSVVYAQTGSLLRWPAADRLLTHLLVPRMAVRA